MGNMCCRRVGYSPNGTEVDSGRCHQQQPSSEQQPKSQPMSNAYHSAGDDCAINELLEGRMDLDVVLPDGRKVRLTVERRTPMMDLLVQAASATKISPAGHTIHVFGDDGKGSSTLHYKPSTPIGSLDANTICIVPKKDPQDTSGRRVPKTANRPFEPTFRVQVHLPRNQLTVTRVSPKVKISELRNMVCQEKGLDTNRYQLVRPSVPGQPLSGNMTLAEYGATEITLLSNSCIQSHICNSTSHIMPYSKRTEDQKKKTGILRLLAEDANHKALKKTNGSALHRPAPTIKVTEAPHQGRYKPKKRRPAPPPPPPTLPEPPFHSRQSSSDSSGYHEATSSYLHEDHCVAIGEKASSDSSGVSSLDAKVSPGPMTTVQSSNVLNAKKRKAPPPPPPGNDKDRSVDKEEEPMKPCKLDDGCSQSVQPQLTMDIKIRPPVDDVARDDDKRAEEETIPQTSVELSVTENNDRSVQPPKIKENPVERNKKGGEAVTRVALVALNARIEQDVTQQEIASSIQAAFHSLDSPQRTAGPSLLAIKQRAGRAPEKIVLPVTESSSESEDDILTTPSSKTFISNHTTEELPLPPRTEGNPVTPVSGGQSSILLTRGSHSILPTGGPPSIHVIGPKSTLVTQEHASTPASGGRASIQLTPGGPPADKPQVTPGDIHSIPYPLQKSSARLNFEPKQDPEGVIEAFPPPPSEFRGIENEALLIDDQEPVPCPPTFRSSPTKTLRRSSSLLNLTDAVPPRVSSPSKKTRLLQRSLSDLTVDDKGEFEAEQERLQREYLKLQRQFILWQQQLLNNHAMLRDECIVPQYARTLRQSHSLPDGQDYTDNSSVSCPLVARSLSYEPTKDRCSTLPRSAINIPPLEFGTIPTSNGSSTLRSSKTKSYFKPPQVRLSTKNRQRLPPEIRKDGDLDIYDDTKILSTILPSFESLKLISESNDDDIGSLILRNGVPTPKSEKTFCKQQDGVKKVPPPVPNKLATFPKPSANRQNNERNKMNGHLKCVNNGVGSESLRICDSVQVTEQSNSPLPPPPPPLPVSEKAKGPSAGKANSVPGPKTVTKKIITPEVDPREQLMQEIRRCGGRTALRKISLDIASS